MSHIDVVNRIIAGVNVAGSAIVGRADLAAFAAEKAAAGNLGQFELINEPSHILRVRFTYFVNRAELPRLVELLGQNTLE